MNILQKISENFFNIKIIHKFLSVLIILIIGFIVISYTFESALTISEKNSAQMLAHSQADKKIITNISQNISLYQRITTDTNLAADNKLLQIDAIIKIMGSELEQLNANNQLLTQIQTDFPKTHKSLEQLFFIELILIIIVTISLLWLIVSHGIVLPIAQLQKVIYEIVAGNLDARVDNVRNDEIGNLTQAFDLLLDERMSSLAKTEDDHLQLNSSIITLLRAVSVLSKKDLTIKIPVAEDMTGAVSDSINLLTSEIAATLKEVTQISVRVNSVSAKVKQQSGNVMLFADNQRKEIDATLDKLNTAVNTMVKIAQFSQVTNKESEKTMLTTESAVEAVANTITSINAIRDIIRETEKRIKRLGERSQEITGVVNIINNIAERTHVLSLNAGMQAAAAGESGKSFMVVANEVQRLAESSREATEKIATLVKNIQVDTSDTMKTMNTVISQVVDGTQQAEEAGKRMKESRATTQSLIAAVKKIAATTIAQLEVGKSLKEHAHNIQTSTIKTNEQLQQQRDLSDALANDAEELIVKVSVFKLPE